MVKLWDIAGQVIIGLLKLSNSWNGVSWRHSTECLSFYVHCAAILLRTCTVNSQSLQLVMYCLLAHSHTDRSVLYWSTHSDSHPTMYCHLIVVYAAVLQSSTANSVCWYRKWASWDIVNKLGYKCVIFNFSRICLHRNLDVSRYSDNCMLFIPCIVDSQLTTLNQQNTLCSTFDIYIKWNTDTCFDPDGIIISEHVSNNIAWNSGSYFVHIWTSYAWCKIVKCMAFVEYLCT